MDRVINHLTVRATSVGPWLGSAIAVSFVLSSAAARADEPSAPPSTPVVVAPTPTVVAPSPAVAAPPPAIAAPPPAIAAPTYAVPSWSAPTNGQPPPAGYYAPPPPRQEALRGPDVIPAKGEEAPIGYHVEYRMRKGSLIAGAVIFGLSYGFSVLAASSAVANGEPGMDALFIPVVGPFIASASSTGSNNLMLLPDGVIQVGGAAALAVGLLAKRRLFVRDDVAKSFVMPVPMRFGANSAGVGMVGTF